MYSLPYLVALDRADYYTLIVFVIGAVCVTVMGYEVVGELIGQDGPAQAGRNADQ